MLTTLKVIRAGVFIFVLNFSRDCFAQLGVSNGYTATQLATHLCGSNVAVTNASLTGEIIQNGQFTFSGIGFPATEGVILSTGSIFDSPGPNSSSSTTTGTGAIGNSLLTSISGQPTFDAVVLQFDFKAQSDNIELQYVFASEEYNEFVGSNYDVFGIFVSGPGIAGEENIALVPATSSPVSINSINLTSHFEYYINNETGSTNIEFDGYTTLLTAQKTGLVPCQTYTLKIIIADAIDNTWDSALFLLANSLVQQNVTVQSNTASTSGIAIEGCVQESFTFNLGAVYTFDAVIPFQLQGTAIEGIDYQNLDASVIVPAGQTSGVILINTITDSQVEGQENIDLIYQSSTCGIYDTVTLYIDDHEFFEIATSISESTCLGETDGEILFAITGGTSPYSFVFTDTSTNATSSYFTNPVTGISEGTFMIAVTDAIGCLATELVTIKSGSSSSHLAFSPNNDGINDYLFIPCAEKMNNTVRIFNRWGDEIAFFTNYNNQDNVWFGKDVSGNSTGNEVYFYILEPESVTTSGADIFTSGWVQIVR